MAATDFKAMTRRGTCRSCRKRRLLDQSSHLCGICHISQASIWQVARQSKTPPAVATSTALTRVDAGPMERMQLYSNFVQETHSTTSSEETRRIETISYLTGLQSTDVLSPMLTTAIDALSWAHTGAVHSDKRLTHASHDAYGRVLTSLRKVIESPGSANRPAHWEVLATVMLMSIVDTTLNSESTSTESESPWMTHFWGAQQYLSSIGASSLDLEHVVSRVMTFSIYQSTILIGIARRKTIDLKAPQWADKPEEDLTRPWGVVQMQHRYLTFQPVAGLLEETDRLIDIPDSCSILKLHGLWQRLEQTRDSVAQTVTEGESHAITISAASEDKLYDFDIEEHWAISESCVFTEYFNFDQLDAGVYYSCTVMILLIVDCTFLRILHFNPSVSTFPTARDEDEIERDAFSLASRLCQCVHYFSKLDSLAYAHFTVMLLVLARNVFETQGKGDELGWCQACLVAVQTRVARISVQRRPTLCRIGDLPPGIPTAGLYRTCWGREERRPSGCPMKALPAPRAADVLMFDKID